jgi:acetyl-CoA synthetase
MSQTQAAIESIMQETRVFNPPKDFASKARIKSHEEYDRLYRESIEKPEEFWSRIASELHWFKKWDKVVEWNLPYAKWFIGGKTNISYNCLDRPIEQGRGDKTAIIWEGEPLDGGKPEVRHVSYKQLLADVCRFANGLKKLGVKKGDRVTIYMPLVPEAAVAMLACARLGAPHSVIFGGFSSQAIVDRVEDAKSNYIITADGTWRRGKIIHLKNSVDEAAEKTSLIKKVVVLRHVDDGQAKMQEGRDVWWQDLVADQSETCPPEQMDAEDLLFVLYTSAPTGKPKGIVHTTGGYLTQVKATTKWVMDLKDDDIYWCTADIGWVTGHSYIVYGPLSNGATALMFEGTPTYPESDRWWQVVEDHKVTILYTAPTAIRAFIKGGT